MHYGSQQVEGVIEHVKTIDSPAGVWYALNLSSDMVGTHAVELFFDGVQLTNSPVLVEVVGVVTIQFYSSSSMAKVSSGSIYLELTVAINGSVCVPSGKDISVSILLKDGTAKYLVDYVAPSVSALPRTHSLIQIYLVSLSPVKDLGFRILC